MDEGKPVPVEGGGSDSPPHIEQPKHTTEVDIRPAIVGLIKWAYTNNPFYVLSAWLVFLGLRLSFDTTAGTFQTNSLMIGLTGYTILLAVSACYLIRVGRLWQDVRSMLVLVVLMFLAISVCFDDTLARNPRVGTFYYLGGLAFSALLSEGLLFGLPLRLPAAFRVPYYCVLALFFLYPVALSPLVYEPSDPRLQWGLFGFSAAAGVVFLTLLPAVRLGPDYLRDNGSPWPWPWYPWVLFGTLALGVLGRAYSLCISLHFVGYSRSIFGTYFWVPFLLALSVVFLEMAVVSRRAAAIRLAMVAPLVTLILATSGESKMAANLRFPETFAETLGATPLYLTLIAVTVFYALCVVRRIPHAADGLSVSLALYCVCGPATANMATLIGPRAFPFVLIAIVQFLMAIRQRNASRCLISVGCVLVAAAINFPATSFRAQGTLIPFHIMLAVVLLTGVVLRDKFGRFVQHVGAVLIVLAGVPAAVCDSRILGDQTAVFLELYPVLAIAAAVAYGYIVRNRAYFLSAAAVLAAWLAMVGWHVYLGLRKTMAGLDYLFFGLLLFLVALLISLNKAGALRRWFLTRCRQSGDVHKPESSRDT